MEDVRGSGLRNWVLEQLAMYAAYHRDRRNQATHHVGVPVIVFSLLLAFDQITLASGDGLRISLGLVFIGGLIGLYLLTIPMVGVLALAFYTPVYLLATAVAHDQAMSVAGVCFCAGWAVQFCGHVFEGRRPALFDNFVQVFMAPGFLLAEMLFGVGGGTGLASDLEARSAKYAILP